MESFNENSNFDTGKQKIVIRSPEKLTDVEEMIDCLVQGEPVIFNLELLEKNSAQRVMDFIAGAVYAINGKITHMERCRFIATPNSMDVRDWK